MPADSHVTEEGVVKYAVVVHNSREGPPVVLLKRCEKYTRKREGF
jgi:hypothetical protein